ncbi:DNA-binding transcriptional regulator, MerR family [Parafrankia irregularis]|uniref:DNA-binding transcriptional regulator, MerR family n=1 Tax=Parafrankia irregularis TaxID=795642 RepID=A0A0S4QEY4_9ACTN|nr:MULTISPECIES: MerR family transcriptional regulator [Parafrankia]MBE3203237.1 MerR family transcriptional regulator [Parafrankia sp. CH37]CUU54116.1 DNA-binding transcriptional regulator, MerR family [Parafrankia irregularis]
MVTIDGLDERDLGVSGSRRPDVTPTEPDADSDASPVLLAGPDFRLDAAGIADTAGIADISGSADSGSTHSGSADSGSDVEHTVAPPLTGLTIAEAAKVTGVSAHTLRYYERVDLMLERVSRAPSSHRRYDDEDLRWVGTLTALRRTGMPIRQIARYAALVRAGDGNEAQRLDLLAAHRRLVAERLEEVRRHLTAIDNKIDIYRKKVDD